jgi:hypothetical protein
MKEISEEFIKYGSGDKHQQIVNTCIKEYFVDSGVGIKKYTDAILDLGGENAGYILKNALNIYQEKINYPLSYLIV